MVKVATGELTNVTADTVGLADGMEAYPSFSPDGTELAFAAYGPATCEDGQIERAAFNLYTINVDGSGLSEPRTDFDRQRGAFGL